MFKSNRQLLAEFSAATGIVDAKVEQVVAGYGQLPSWAFSTITSTQTTASAMTPVYGGVGFKDGGPMYYKMGVDKGTGKDYSRINWNFGSQKNIDSYWAELWRAFITYRFKQGLEAGFAHSRQEEDEVDLREVYETEWRLKDILPKDGWTPHED